MESRNFHPFPHTDYLTWTNLTFNGKKTETAPPINYLLLGKFLFKKVSYIKVYVIRNDS